MLIFNTDINTLRYLNLMLFFNILLIILISPGLSGLSSLIDSSILFRVDLFFNSTSYLFKIFFKISFSSIVYILHYLYFLIFCEISLINRIFY